MPAYGYIRVSTPRQANKGISLGDQRAAIETYCAQKGFGAPLVFADPGKTSKTPFASREAGGKLVEVVQTGDHIVMTRIDRGFRNLSDFLHWFDVWINRGVHLHVIDFGGNTIDPTTSIGRMVFRVLAVVAEMERDVHSERIKEAHAHFHNRNRSMTGRTMGCSAPGFKPQKAAGGGFRPVNDPEMRAWMSMVLDLWRDPSKGNRSKTTLAQRIAPIKATPGNMTMNQIAEYLWKSGKRCPRDRGRRHTRYQQCEVHKWIQAEIRIREHEELVRKIEHPDG